jgi:error-prone DNA polymerase
MGEQNYVELQATTHFSFLRGASSCEELFVQAATLDLPALGITDRNSLAGMVRAHEAAKVTGIRLIVGCRLDLEDFPSILVYRPIGPAMDASAVCLPLARAGLAKASAPSPSRMSSNGVTS